MSDMLVTIVIPTYDRVGWLETAVESVLSQDHPAIELLVIDDGSADETPALLERIAARAAPGRMRHLRHDNVGQSATINRGFALARGELLGYLSSDDYLLPGAISRLVAEAQAHPEAEVLYPGFRIADGADHVRDTLMPLPHTLADAVRWAACMPGAGVLVRRRLYERIGGWDPSYRHGPDYEWWIRAGDAVFHPVPEVLAVWRAHDGSITTGGMTMESVRERLRLLDDLYARDDLPQDVVAVRAEAYAALLAESAAAMPGGRVGQPGARFVIQDALAPSTSQAAHDSLLHGYNHLMDELRALEHTARMQQEAEEQLRATVAALETTAAVLRGQVDRRDERILALDERLARAEGELAALRAAPPATPPAPATPSTPARPAWMRAGRRLTPAGLRPRLGAAVHRARGRR